MSSDLFSNTIMKYERFNKWMSRIKIPWWVYHQNVNGCNYRDLEKMLLKAYKLGIKHSKENSQRCHGKAVDIREG